MYNATLCSKAASSFGKLLVRGAEKLHDSNSSDRMDKQSVHVQDEPGIRLSTGCRQDASSCVLQSLKKESRLPNT